MQSLTSFPDSTNSVLLMAVRQTMSLPDKGSPSSQGEHMESLVPRLASISAIPLIGILGVRGIWSTQTCPPLNDGEHIDAWTFPPVSQTRSTVRCDGSLSNLGAYKLDIVYESHTVAFERQVLDDFDILDTIGAELPVDILAIKTEKEMDGIMCEIVLKSVTLHTLELKADGTLPSFTNSDAMLQVFDDNGSSKPVSGRKSIGNICRNTEFLLISKPNYMEVASTPLEIGEKSFYCIYRVQ